MLDYSIGGRVCIAGMTPKDRFSTIYLVDFPARLLSVRTLNFHRNVQTSHRECSYAQFDFDELP